MADETQDAGEAGAPIQVETPFDETIAQLQELLGDTLLETSTKLAELTIEVRPDAIVRVLSALRDDVRMQYWSLIDLCGVDWPNRAERFDIVYHLLSPKQNARIRIKLRVDEETAVPSVISVYPNADWYEREVYDLYGVFFSGHPDLRRLLTDYGFDGHPLRKDFPLTGFVEVRYDDDLKRVVYEPVRLQQEFRSFDFLSPWEGPQYVLPGDEKASEKPH
jgi:NADH-quinone oxidoreductase subunit C